ncbi:MAG: TonB-dependent receptor [Chlorobi bacterium]|nr:TonB-dependent receptor [Chlorobiota bacterium]
MRRFFLLLLFLSLYWTATGQQQRVLLQGRVYCRNKPVSGVKVETDKTGQTAETGSNGMFRMQLPPGNYRLNFYADECFEQIKIELKKDTTITVRMRPYVTEKLRSVVIDAGLADKNTPVAITEIGRRQLEEKDNAKDIPYLLDDIPSAVSFSDAGNGVGYTGIRIRGISPQQINVSINGIPLNDPESQSVYWVDIPDMTASARGIQVQRGVGISQFGTGAFGANINLTTLLPSRHPGAMLHASLGSFNTRKISGQVNSGKLRNGFSFNARASMLHSDGYIDRAFSDMKSYYLAAGYENGPHSLTFIHFGGHERTYQAWYGVDWETFRTNPTFNYAGAIYDANWNITGYYDDQVDDYTQQHYQLHYRLDLADRLDLRAALHYTKGFGYYEQYKQDQKFAKYGMEPLVFGSDTVNRTDLVRRKWLDNDFYGAVLTATIPSASERGEWILGLAANRYDGRHFGRVIWARFADHTEKGHTYYFNEGIKTEYNGFVRNRYEAGEHLSLFSDIQVRHVDYTAGYDPARTYDEDEAFEISDHLTFVNPKAGLTYDFLDGKRLFASFGIAHREPNRTDYKENAVKPKPERLYDLETGFAWEKAGKWQLELNYYYMYYKDQLVYTGKLNSTGYPIRENVGRSYRTGLEASFLYRLPNWHFMSSLNLSDNRNLGYRAWENGTLKDYGKTRISYSPSVVGHLRAEYFPLKNLSLWASFKYVGEQYLDNRNIPESVLPAYHYTDAGLRWQIKNKWGMKRILAGLNIFNIFDRRFAANGYMWGDTAYVFPQAERHFSLNWQITF